MKTDIIFFVAKAINRVLLDGIAYKMDQLGYFTSIVQIKDSYIGTRQSRLRFFQLEAIINWTSTAVPNVPRGYPKIEKPYERVNWLERLERMRKSH